MYEFKVEISDIHVWYRESTKEWVAEVSYKTPNVCGIMRYPSRKRNKAKSMLYKNLHKIVLELEIREAFKSNDIKWIES